MDHFGDLDTHRRIILKWFFKKFYKGMDWMWFGLRMGSNGAFVKTPGCVKAGEFLDQLSDCLPINKGAVPSS
jgi:hypothetical protein